ncbi:extracellular solute-binding protein [Chitinivorax sp. B]|uniref:ABC transporter substrate-binding protein n=1 Tax=Chitinivorax sp. B TaxID=2502235 RepID=UPI0010F67692|nr:extracellular solute-binding protein [Chitinivorax sp. B]
MTTLQEDIIAYSAMEEYELEEYAVGIEATFPTLHLKIERMSTSALLDRLLSEGPNGRWDVLFGWALTTMMDPRLQSLFSRLTLPGLNALPAHARDPAGRWFCPSAFVPAFCLNDQRLAERGLPAPTSWADLAKPCYRNELVIPDPRFSGAGFLHLTALLQANGPELAWSMLRRVAENRPCIERSAFAPCLAIANGEASIGVTVTIAAERMRRLGLPVHMVVPHDAAGTEPEGFALHEGSKHQAAGRQILGWMLTPDAHTIYRKYRKVGLMPHSTPVSGELPAGMFGINVGQAINDRAATCAQWVRLFNPPPA